MGTWFEAVLVGDDREHLEAVAGAVLDEIGRVEKLLSRFDPASEVSRINREATLGAVLVDREVMALLQLARRAWERTAGAFDLTATAPRPGFEAVELDPERRRVRFTRPGLALDFGAIGKGYALDRAAGLLAAYSIGSALLHGGTSSVLAIGTSPGGESWAVGLRDPGNADGSAFHTLRLQNRALSCSAAFDPRRVASDLIDPHRGEPLTDSAACVVLARTAVEAEVLSTALLVLGRERASKVGEEYQGAGVDLGWIDHRDGRAVLDWLSVSRAESSQSGPPLKSSQSSGSNSEHEDLVKIGFVLSPEY